MSEPNFLVLFHSVRMLLTLDLNEMIQVLMEAFGTNIAVTFRPMSEAERVSAEYECQGITMVRSRFILKQIRDDGSEVRLAELEERIVDQGRK
jgi:hypothetical protein